MNLQQPSSQASSHFTLEPIPASVLAEKEARRREAVALLGSCKTGCPVVDADVLLGGFDRASIVGISAEDEELGVQVRAIADLRVAPERPFTDFLFLQARSSDTGAFIMRGDDHQWTAHHT